MLHKYLNIIKNPKTLFYIGKICKKKDIYIYIYKNQAQLQKAGLLHCI